MQIPVILKEIAEIIGAEKALILSTEFPGRRIYFGSRPNAALIAAVGLEAANLLCCHYRGEWMYIPKYFWISRRNAAIAAALEKDSSPKSKREIAKLCGLTYRQVGNIGKFLAVTQDLGSAKVLCKVD